MHLSERALEQAATLFGLGTLTHLGGQEGAVYESTRDGSHCILKGGPIPPDRVDHATAGTAALYDFMAYMAAHGVSLSRPLRSLSGRWLEVVQADGGLYLFLLSEKAQGHHVACGDHQQWNGDLFRHYGRPLGRMCAPARAYPEWRRRPDEATAELDGTTHGILHDWRAEHKGFVRAIASCLQRHAWCLARPEWRG